LRIAKGCVAAGELASAELDEVMCRQRSAGTLRELPADRERTEIDAEEAEPIDQWADLGFGKVRASSPE